MIGAYQDRCYLDRAFRPSMLGDYCLPCYPDLGNRLNPGHFLGGIDLTGHFLGEAYREANPKDRRMSN